MFMVLKYGITDKTEKSQVFVYTGIGDIASIPLKNVFMSIKRSHYADIKNVVTEMIVHSFMKPG